MIVLLKYVSSKEYRCSKSKNKIVVFVVKSLYMNMKGLNNENVIKSEKCTYTFDGVLRMPPALLDSNEDCRRGMFEDCRTPLRRLSQLYLIIQVKIKMRLIICDKLFVVSDENGPVYLHSLIVT